MRDAQGANASNDFQDLVPWADPYIVALIEKLRRDEESETVSELPPPFDHGEPDQDAAWRGDWLPRGWPLQ